MMVSDVQPLSEEVKDNPLVRRVLEEVEANLRNEQFGVEKLADNLGISRSQLHRKLKQVTGKSANQYIREYRLTRAMDLLQNGEMSVSEVANAVGFGSASYFSACFAEHFGYPPGEVKKRAGSATESAVAEEVRETTEARVRVSRLAMAGNVILALALVLVVYVRFFRQKDVAAVPGKSIAVIPFRNLNADAANTYFSDGVVEAINRKLSGISDLRVVSVLSTDKYRESTKSAGQIARELGVSNLLEGSVQRVGDMVRIEVRLIEAATEAQIWAENFDREFKDIFKTESEIAERVATTLKATLSPEVITDLNRQGTVNPAAYDLYLKGLYDYHSYTPTGHQRALEYFSQAVALDSTFALAYAGMAGCYILKASIFGAELGALEAMALARPLLDKALSIDPELPDAHAWKAFYLLYNDWDFAGAESEYRKAIASGNPDALGLYSDLLNFLGRHDEALVMARKLNETDPFYPGSRLVLSYYYNDMLEEAFDEAEARTKLLNNYLSLDSYGFLLLNTGHYEEAISIFDRYMDAMGTRYPRMLGWMGAAYAHAGKRVEALRIIDELKERRHHTTAGSLAFFTAVVYTALGDSQSALQWLEESFNSHEMEIPWLISEPQLKPLHGEPTFQELVARVRFPVEGKSVISNR
ncbi:MAG TPA: helix-turn-helix domain-containing protein [Cyclobacteriaceae bacterium]|jgi:TolB-like protein/AraC-like DNA-binding protein/Tfp pilus assembly protein PilF